MAAKQLATTKPAGSVPVDLLRHWPLVGLDGSAGIRRLIQFELRNRGFNVNLNFVAGTGTGGWSAAKEFARQGLGVAVLPLSVLTADDPSDLVVRRLSGVVIHDHLIHRPQKLNSGQDAVKQSLIQSARRHQKATRAAAAKLA